MEVHLQVERVTFHELRHSFGSQLVIGGAPIKGVQELLGHADIKMTLRYAHLGSRAHAAVLFAQGRAWESACRARRALRFVRSPTPCVQLLAGLAPGVSENVRVWSATSSSSSKFSSHHACA